MTFDVSLSPNGYQQLTVSTVAVALTVPAGTRRTLVYLEASANGVRYRDDGTNPTATVGMPIGTGTAGAGPTVLEYEGDATKLKFIRSAAADAILNVSYYA